MSNSTSKINEGRPCQYSEPKKSFTITITPTAIGNLKALAEGMGMTRSEVIERIARNQITLLPPIDARLQVYLKPQPQVFLTISEFTRRCLTQIGALKQFNPSCSNDPQGDLAAMENEGAIEMGKESREKVVKLDCKSYEEEAAERITNLILKATSILYAVDRSHPDLYLPQMILPLKCIIFYLIVTSKLEELGENYDPNESKTDDIELENIYVDVNKKKVSLVNENSSAVTCSKILKALARLKIQSPGDYQILEMTFKGGLSLSQIAHIKSINHNTMTSFSVRKQLNGAIHALRRYIHDKHENSQFLEDVELIQQQFMPRSGEFAIEKKVHAYYNLCLFGQMELQEHRKAVRHILKSAYNNRRLKFWLWEIDHWTGHQLTSLKQNHIGEESKIAGGLHNIVQEKLKKSLGLKIEQTRDNVDRRIGEIRDEKQMISCLEEILEEESGITGKRRLVIEDIKQFFKTHFN